MIEQYKVNMYIMYVFVIEFLDFVYYEMFGYDILLGLYYDKYEIDYVDYFFQMLFFDIFDIKGLFLFKWV